MLYFADLSTWTQRIHNKIVPIFVQYSSFFSFIYFILLFYILQNIKLKC